MEPVRSLVTNSNLQSHASANDMQQGREYMTQNQVRITHREDARIDGQVADPATQQTHNVTLTSGDFGLSWTCSCGSSGGTSSEAMMCPHTIAVALAAQ